MRAPALALAAFEVAVRRRRAALARRELIWIHSKTHRAAGLPPLRAGGGEDLTETFRFGLGAHPHRARHDEHPHAVGHVAAAKHVGDHPQILDAPVGARTDENGVHRDVAHCGTRRKIHVRQRFFGSLTFSVVEHQFGVGHRADSGTPWPGLVPHVTNGLNVDASM